MHFGADARAISLTQPWATLIMLGKKRIETRSWTTSFRGPLYIHAAKEFPPAARAFKNATPFREALATVDYFPTGAILGSIDLVAIRLIGGPGWEDPPEPELSFGDYHRTGRYAWFLERPVVFDDPIPMKGALGLWRPLDSC